MDLITVISFVAQLLIIQGIGPAAGAQLQPLQRQLAAMDSAYQSRDTLRLAAATSQWKGKLTPLIRFYRGVSQAWSGNKKEAIALIRPVLDSASNVLTAPKRRDAVRILSQSYAKLGQYDQAAAIYDSELRMLDSAVDQANARTRAIQDSFESAPILRSLSSPEQISPPPPPEKIPTQVGFIALLFSLFLVPKVLQRFRIPGAITSLLMGVAATSLGWSSDDPTVRLLSTLGITSLFLFAGLEVDTHQLRRDAKPLLLHMIIWTTLALITATIVFIAMPLPPRAAALVALALVTPSTGFILSTLSSFGLRPIENRTVRTYAIGSELIALATLFFVLQSTSLQQLALSIALLAGVVIVIPLSFRAFATMVAPYAPRSEFAFLLMVGVACAYATTLLGVYYLVGAFVVGFAAQQFRESHPAMSSEKMVDALESFGSVFIPFYFFYAGTEIQSGHLEAKALIAGAALVVALVPLRVAVISLHRKLTLNESFANSRRVASAMIPTLVFTLVIVGILRERYALSPTFAGALVIYTVVNTTLPGFILRSQPADFEDVEALPIEGSLAEG